jgi:hypothetical protein
VIAQNETPRTVATAQGADTTTIKCEENSTTTAQNTGSADPAADLEAFYTTIWPPSGIYALFTLPDRKHHQCTTIANAVAKTIALNATPGVQAVYHACASYKEASYICADGAARFRVQANAGKVNSFLADIDCGEQKAAEGKGYRTKKEALGAVMGFCREHGLPPPTHVIDSGNGLHLYWGLTEEIDAAIWTATATALDALFKAGNLLVDPSRTKDVASILRPPGTTNRKNPDNHKAVKLMHRSAPVEFGKFNEAIATATNMLGIKVPAVASSAVPDYMQCDSGNLAGLGEPTYAPSDANTVADRCAQIEHFRKTGCADSEPLWYATLGVVKSCADGEAVAHEWSAKDDRYDHKETQRKLDQWNTGPTTCDKFKELNPTACVGCKHKCKSPIQLGVVTAVLMPPWLIAMNDQYAWIEKEAVVYRIAYRDFIAMEKFHAAHANQTRPIQTRNGVKHVAVSRLWLMNKDRKQHPSIVTKPGEPPVTADGCLNDWAGFSVEPIPGDVDPFKQLYAYLFGDDMYALHWLAHLLKFPGIKMFVGLVVWSTPEGVGKNLLFETVGALLNRHHYALIGQSEVEDDFCGWIPGTVFVIADEVRASKNERSRDRLKLWTTATTLRTHDKGQPKRNTDNLMNAVFLSNHADGMFLSDHDRRFYVHEVKADPLPEALKRLFLNWRANGGPAHLLHYLQSIDLTGFDPKDRAPVTESKREMIEAGRSDLDRWALDIVSGALPVGKDIATAEELANRFCITYPNVRNSPAVATVGKVLVRMGAYRRENQVRLTDGRKVRALALVRVDYWKDQPEAAWRVELEKRK